MLTGAVSRVGGLKGRIGAECPDDVAYVVRNDPNGSTASKAHRSIGACSTPQEESPEGLVRELIHLGGGQEKASHAVDVACRGFKRAGLTVNWLDRTETSVRVDVRQHTSP